MIKSFANDNVEKIFKRQFSRNFPESIHRAALRKLLYLNRAQDINDMRVSPGNRLEKLEGKRSGQYSIRINDQWRICFRWEGKDAFDVDIVDYH